MATRRLAQVYLIGALSASLAACARQPQQSSSPIYQRVVRTALPHDLNPRNSVTCIGAHNDRGELYDLGCNSSLEHDPMVGIYKAVFSENPDRLPAQSGDTAGNVAGSAWRCQFADNEAKLICERLSSK